MMMPKWLSFLILLPCLVTACAQDVVVPESTYQSASDLLSRSLSTVDPEESLPLFEYDWDAPLGIQEVKRWRQDGVNFIDLTYQSPRGGRVPATLMIPDGRGPFAGMVFLHGSGGSRKDYYWLGAEYAHLGALSIAIDAPYIRPDHYIKTPYMSGSWPRWNEVDRDEQIQLVIDLQRAVDLLVARPEVDPDRIAYLGYSYGGAMGGLFAGIERRLQAYVLMVGDGGLVEHLSDPDENGYPYHWSERWVALCGQ
jgi:predicted esterase